MNTHSNSMASAMPAITRRAALVEGRPQSPRQSRPSAVYKAIADHKKVHAAFNDCCDAADRMSPNYGGPKAEARWKRLDRAEDRALVKLIATPAVTTDEAKAKSAYLLTHMRHSELQSNHVEALIRAIAQVSL